MDTIRKNLEWLAEDKLVILAWAVIVLVILLMLMFASKEKFINEFRSAPINYQLPTSQLGIGVTSRFQEFSSTNQGGSHVVGESAARSMEHMMGSSEAPVYFSGDKELDEYQTSTVGSSGQGEFFSGKPLYSDAFSNPDDKLKQVLSGH